jgi:hypothetical protein
MAGLTTAGSTEGQINVGYHLKGMFLSFTTFPIHCPYWPGRGTSPHSSSRCILTI